MPALTPSAPLALPVRLRPLQWLATRLEIRRQRVRLSELDARFLRDVGLDRADVARELQRPIWNAPAHWLARPRG